MILAIRLNGYGDRLNVSPNHLRSVYFLPFNGKASVYVFSFTVTNVSTDELTTFYFFIVVVVLYCSLLLFHVLHNWELPLFADNFGKVLKAKVR